METATVSIKIKGLGAINALSAKGQLLSGLGLKGIAAGKGATLKVGEFEAKRIIATKHGLVLQTIEVEGKSHAAAAATKATAGKALAVKGAAAAPAIVGPSAALGAKHVGWSLGLGGVGPWLVLGALGLAATGIYLYLRAQRMQDAVQEELEDFAPPA